MPVVLGVDPGLRTGWALLEGEDADSLRVMKWGTSLPEGAAIQPIIQYAREVTIDTVVAIERQFRGQLLMDTYGRWLGLAEAEWLHVVGVYPAAWKSRFIGPHRTPKTVTDPETGLQRPLLPPEKRAAKRSADEAYRLLAIERFGLPADIPADVAAACWIAAYAIDEIVRAAA